MRTPVVTHPAQLEDGCGKLNSGQPELRNKESLGFNITFTSFSPKNIWLPSPHLKSLSTTVEEMQQELWGELRWRQNNNHHLVCSRCVFRKLFFFLPPFFLPFFFFPFAFSYPSPVQTQTHCPAYEVWQLYSLRLDGYRLMFFLDSANTPGNELTDSRMILKGSPPPLPTPSPRAPRNVWGMPRSFLIGNRVRKDCKRGPPIPPDKKQDLGDRTQPGMGGTRSLHPCPGIIPIYIGVALLKPYGPLPSAPSPTSTPHVLKFPGLLTSLRKPRNMKSSSHCHFWFCRTDLSLFFFSPKSAQIRIGSLDF